MYKFTTTTAQLIFIDRGACWLVDADVAASQVGQSGVLGLWDRRYNWADVAGAIQRPEAAAQRWLHTR